MLSFLFISSSALALLPEKDAVLPELIQTRSYKVSKLPVLRDANSFPIVSAQGALAIDLDSAVVLYEKNPDAPLLPASTTKIMTALVAIENFSRDEVVRVGKLRAEGQKMGLSEGEEITVEDLLYGLLVYSANDAAEALAASYPGGREKFVLAMNQKARELHLDSTVFKNPTGLDENGHVSTARDMVRLSEVAMRDPYFSRIVGTKEKEIKDKLGNVKYRLRNINELVGSVDGVKGVKTGWTENARENLVTYVEKDKKRVMIALLGSQDRFGETKELIDWIFSTYQWTDVIARSK